MSSPKPNLIPVNDLPAIFLNPDGTVEYPSIIPPHVEFPVVSPGGSRVSRSVPRASAPGDEAVLSEPPVATRPLDATQPPPTSHPPQPPNLLPLHPLDDYEYRGPSRSVEEVQAHENAEDRRPSLARVGQTEGPERRRSSILPGLFQWGSRVSDRGNTGGEHPHAGESEDSSSPTSSSDESTEETTEDGEDQEDKQRGRGRLASLARTMSVSSMTSHKSAKRKSPSQYRKFEVGNDMFKSKGAVSKNDGRLKISLNETENSGYLAKALGATFLKHLGRDHDGPERQAVDLRPSPRGKICADFDLALISKQKRLSLNIVIMVIGSRGDIQPFLKLGKVLKEDYGHRVRIATHPAFRDFVEQDSGLEFFSVGGDPAELMAFMVKNPGMIPTMETLKKGEVGRRRDAMAEMFEGFWRACINATDDEHDVKNLKMMGTKDPFIADAIIANPPSFAHVHCAESLGIPLHLMFTFPYTPTQAFPHPLANIKKTNVDPGYTNFMSYPLVELMTWQGLGDLVNHFRVYTLGLEPVSTLWAPGQLYRLRVPYTYLWSPGLVPKPKDWGPEIRIAGFVFLDLASTFEPPESLVEFLEAGEPPVYIGFGSIVVDDPDAFTKMIYEAVEMAGVRALVSKGWGGFGSGGTPKNVYLLENTPHDWLFPKVKAVVHHGGAGTTAIGLKCGKPTLVVPFFGDQFFWGNMIGKAGAGGEPIPYKDLTAEKLAKGIKKLLEDETQKQADKFAKRIEEEGDGAQNAVRSFHRSLTIRGEQSMRCSILDDQLAVWILKKTNLKLSALAADLLVAKKKIHWKELRLYRHTEWNDFEGPGEPVTGGATAVAGNLASVATGLASIPFRLAKSARKRQHHEEKKKRKELKAKAKAGRRRWSIGGGQNGTTVKPANGNAINGNHQNIPTEDLHKKVEMRDMLPDNQVPNVVASMQGEEAATQIQGGRAPEPPPTANGEEEEYMDDNDSILTTEDGHDAAGDIAVDIATGLRKSGGALIRTPMDLSTAIAQGFHNAPRLYGDETVRRPTRITGIHSGLKAAGNEFIYGIYDGWTGVLTQPYHGARRDGVLGCVKGVGMGLTGFVLKDLAAVIGPFAYTLKGAQKELHKSRQPTRFLRRARIIQGQRALVALADAERQDAERRVAHGWRVIQEVWAEVAAERGGGLRGHVRALRGRGAWRSDVQFDNVAMAEMALRALREGNEVCLAAVFEKQRRRTEEERVFGRTAARMDRRVKMERAERARRVMEICDAETGVCAERTWRSDWVGAGVESKEAAGGSGGSTTEDGEEAREVPVAAWKIANGEAP